MGGDACVNHAFQGSHVLEKQVRHTRDPKAIFGELIALGAVHHAATYVVDSIGIGAGIVADLKAAGKHVIEVDSGSASPDAKCKNYRAWMWWQAMLAVRKTEVEYPADPETRRQLPYASRFLLDNGGKLQILKKEIIKDSKHLGRSPDDAESWMMGIVHRHKAKSPDEVEVIRMTDAMGAHDFDRDFVEPDSLERLGIDI
jgi:hypothetical protein